MPISPYYRRLRDLVGDELLLLPSVAALIRDAEGRVLVQKRGDGTWSLPAGAIEPGETPEVDFEIKADNVNAREFCNLHGLWKA